MRTKCGLRALLPSFVLRACVSACHRPTTVLRDLAGVLAPRWVLAALGARHIPHFPHGTRSFRARWTASLSFFTVSMMHEMAQQTTRQRQRTRTREEHHKSNLRVRMGSAPEAATEQHEPACQNKQQQTLSFRRAPLSDQRESSGATYTSRVSHGQQQTHGNTKHPTIIVIKPQ